MSSSISRSRSNDTNVSIKYTPCSTGGGQTDEELEEISIVDKDGYQSPGTYSRSEEEEKASRDDQDMSASSEKNMSINGPKLLPSGGGLSVPSSPNDRTKLIGERLSNQGRISLSSPVYSSKVIEQKASRASRQSIFELVRVRTTRKASRDDHFNLMKKVKSSETVTSKGVRKQRRKDIESRFGKKSTRSDKIDNATSLSDRDGCNWTFVFDPSGRLSYWWSSVVSVAFIYNFWVIIYRFAFQEINPNNISIWFTLDYLADFLYILDIAFHFRTGYLEDGVLQTDSIKLRIHYMNTTIFYIDCLCLLPLDFLYLSIGFCSILRCFRLVKVYRFWAFLDRTERHTNYPNVVRTSTLMHYLLALFHWNACLYYVVATRIEGHSNTWEFPKDNGDVLRQYLHALYWSTLTLTTVGNLPRPRTNGDYLFIIFELLFGLMLFATVLGHISNIVSCVSAARKDFQAKLDGVKTYMSLRRVPLRLQDRVIKWFDYLWMCNKSTDEEKTLSLLPDKLKAEIAIHVHLDTLKRVEIFQATEAGFLCELVLRLNPVLFSPGDYICRKGEVGKEMYIVNRGRLHVVGDNGKTVLATLKPGSYFGEISILNMGTSGNRRTASVRSVGYSDLFRLSKQDLWDVLKEYPAARVKLESVAVMRLEKTKKKPMEAADLKRSKSTPGLVESTGQVPLETTTFTRHHTLPPGLPMQSSSNPNLEAAGHAAESSQYQQTSEPHTEGTEIVISQGQETTTKIGTVSSVTSFLTGSPVRSPLCPDGHTPMFHFSPPITPGPHYAQQPNPTAAIPNMAAGSAPGTAIYAEYISGGVPSRDYMPRGNAQITPMHLPYSPYASAYMPSVISQQQQQQQQQHLQQQQLHQQQQQHMTFLSPFCVSPGFISPSSPNFTMSRSNHTGSTHSNLTPSPVGSVRVPTSQQSVNIQTSPGLPSPATGQLPVFNESTHDAMLDEITRLRERLVSLETENAAMSAKLNQQQWEVDHRLSELESHMCPSDIGSSGSTEDRMNPFENINRESII